MESVIWAFKTLHDKGLAYEGYRVLPYCWRDQTPLSNHELRMDDDVYKMRQDQSVTVTFPLIGAKAESLGLTAVRALAWTTTPWTLPTNFALAVGPDIEYAVVPAGPNGTPDATVNREHEGATDTEVLGAEYLLARDLVGSYAKELGYDSVDDARAAVSRTVARRGARGRHATTGSSTTTPTSSSTACRTPGRSSSPTTSRRRTARASCTRRPPTARRTRRSARRPASR